MGKALIIAGLVLCYLCISNYYRIQDQKNSRRKMQENFGKKPEAEAQDISRVGYYMEAYGDNLPVDSITWNDLSMDLVFKRINNCASSPGEEILYYQLHNTRTSKEELEALEKSIGYFTSQETQRCKVLYHIMRIGKKDTSYYIPPYMESIQENRIGFGWLYRLLQILLAVSAAGACVFHNQLFLGILGTNIIVNIILYAVVKMKYETQMDMMATICSLLSVGKKIAAEKIEEENCQKLEKPLRFLKRTSVLMEKMESMRNIVFASEMGILADYLLGATLWHLTSYHKVVKQLERHKEEYMQIYEGIGRLDMIISLASFRQSIPFYTTPKFGSRNEMELEEAYHPLLDEPVCNTMMWKRNCIITGSNASGKSTFIKTAALNAILAQTIHTCTAKKLCMPRADVVTSMAVQDDIMSGDSYFIKEIKYLKRMVEHLGEERCTICVVDEILRGTNTKERIASSQAVLDYLSRKNCLVMAASHDQELTVLLQDAYDNYHFSEKIGKDDIEFDYKLHPGPSVSQNAIRLLEYMGFPEEIITQANQNVCREV